MKCMRCGAAMRTKRGEYHYVDCGLADVVLGDMEISACLACDARSVAIPNVEGLHRAIAEDLAEKPEQLIPQEIRFLRKWLGFSGVDFAALVGKTPETVSRWESAAHPMAMDPAAERLLRLMVLTREPVKEYPLERLGEMAKKKPKKRHRMRLERKPKRGWKVTAHAA